MADVYAFLELKNIDGEAQDSKFKDKIELQSFSWGATNNSSYGTGTGPGIGTGLSCAPEGQSPRRLLVSSRMQTSREHPGS
jgi:type VI protein secretion system component Hcp